MDLTILKGIGDYGISGVVIIMLIFLIKDTLIPMILKKNGNGNAPSKFEIEQTQILKNACENQIETNKKMENAIIKLAEAVTQLIINSTANHATQNECLGSIKDGIQRIESKL